MITLYKQGQDGLRVWKASLEGNTLHIDHGLDSGCLQRDSYLFLSGPEALTELHRRTKYKMDRAGYTKEVPDSPPILPMLALKYKEHKHKLPNIVMVQPKLDGIRCIGSNKGLRSRRNDQITSCPHIEEELRKLPDDIHIDGELYCHGLSFQEHLSLVKRDLPTNKTLNKIKYCVFDLINTQQPYKLRFQTLIKLVNDLEPRDIVITPTEYATLSEIEHFHNNTFKGYEGTIIRDPDAVYEPNKRSSSLQKYPREMREEFEVVQIVTASQGREKGAAIFRCKTPNGKLFTVRPKMEFGRRCVIYENKEQFIGMWTRVTFKEWTPKGLPREPRAEGLRKQKEQLQ